ncbi:NADH-quinone oxidoreductase subunit NuoN [Bacillus sp. HMF5848]|uniref:NADH-quinone oxidoreductase subunit NuoN n=1 Tax=Bacillus sp. HMF5848 TaxID=2495421 RepID=UPI000F7A4BEA|nr:NADH-quinone oxidoreductase subunit NuoN [Bacillus sp. HMF5848]RSK28927.1 NADH-quinone oxidoreductase subunit NuoN [Bacillus sp. HMF5848]
MDLQTLLSYEWGVMTPEFIILGVATILSLIDLFMPNKASRRPLVWIALTGVLLALVSLIGLLDKEVTVILNETFRLDSFAKAFKLILLVGTGLVLLMASHYEPEDGIRHRGEFYYLLLTALLGAMMMTSSGDIITLFVGLELLSLSSYILAGIRKTNKQSNEAAMKYVINGGISTAIMLFGLSYVYGLTGTTNLKQIALSLSTVNQANIQYLLSIAFLLILVGLSFKLATVPFHMWAPDVYQGAPTPVTAFLSVVSKAAGFVIVLRFMLYIFGRTPAEGGQQLSMLFAMQDYIVWLAAATMIVGNTIALRQRNVKRMLAYSSIAHAGYLLVAFAVFSPLLVDAIWFYLVAYLLMNLGVFAILQVIVQKTGSEDIASFAGLYQRAPLIAVAMGVFILSLAGIPGTAGFIGKLNIFLGALMVEPAHYVLASIMLATTVVSYFFYFNVMTQMFFRRSSNEETIKLPVEIAIVVVICVVGTVLFGFLPNIAIDFFNNSFNGFVDFFQ